MSSMGELTFFLGLQVQQKEDGIFISQDKYVAEILKKFDFDSVKTASTPIKTHKPLIKDEEAADVDVTPKTSHLYAVERIFRYLKGKPKLGLWYPRVSSFDLEAYSDSDYAGANLTGNPQHELFNFLAGDLSHGSARNKQLWILLLQRQSMLLLPTAVGNCISLGEAKWQVDLLYSLENDIKAKTLYCQANLSTVKLPLEPREIGMQSVKLMKLEAMVEERRIFKCWFHYHTTNGHQFTMFNRHQELASPEQTNYELASPEQTASGKDFSNPLIVDSLLKTIWLSMHHVVTMKHWLFQSKRLLNLTVSAGVKHLKPIRLTRPETNLGNAGTWLHEIAMADLRDRQYKRYFVVFNP
ncbi:putative ribonuclease H-like domain-containing protein [Tanacetum coccineum]